MTTPSIPARAVNKAKRVINDPKRLKRELAFVKPMMGIKPKPATAVTCLGANWEDKPDLPVAVLWDFSGWKREYIVSYLPEYRLAFANGRPNVGEVKTELGQDWDIDSVVFIGWGRNFSGAPASYAQKNDIPVFNMEDGFLRSFGPGELHSKPHSLVLDKTGMYFDGTRPSDLETLLNTHDFASDKKLQTQAEAAIAMVKAGKLTKYYPLVESDSELDIDDSQGPATLALLQIETDASIKYGRNSKQGRHNRFSNKKFLTSVAELHKTGQVLYRPHPDSKRYKKAAYPEQHENVSLNKIPDAVSLHDAMAKIGNIHTQTSLAGFEALVMGHDVTIHGLPFYAGWGLATEKMKSERRKAKLSVQDVFAGAYLLYPRYLHPASDELCSFFDVAGYFMVEKVKFGDVLTIPKEVINFEALRGHEKDLPAPLRLLMYLDETPFVGSADTEKVMAIAQKNFKLAEFQQFSQLLIQSSNYDALQQYSNLAVKTFGKEWPKLRRNKTLLYSFLRALGTAQKNSNGRVIDSIDDIGKELIALFDEDSAYLPTVTEYARVQSNNLQYQALENLLNELETAENINHAAAQRLCSLLSARPTRSERNHSRRRALRYRAADQYKNGLSKSYPSRYDLFLNTALYHVALDELSGVKNAYDLHLDMFKGKFSFDHPDFPKWGALKRRHSHFYQLFNYLLKSGEYDLVTKMLDEHFFKSSAKHGSNEQVMMENLRLMIKSAQADYRGYVSDLSVSLPATQKIQTTIIGYSKALKSFGEFHRARDVLQENRDQLKTPEKRVAIETEIDKISFSLRTGQILASYPQPKLPKGVIFLASQTCFNTMAMMTPALLALKKKGYAVINIMQGMAPNDPTGIDYIDQFSACLPATLYQHDLQNPWEVNWEKREVICRDVNYYQGFYERLSTAHRIYHVDINQDAINRDFMTQLRRTDMCISICQRIKDAVVDRDINVAFVTGNSHVTPFSGIRDFCRAADDPRLAFINCNVAYESYFSNLGSKFASTMCVTDMTLHKDRRAPFMALGEDFEAWYAENKNNSEFKERADKMIKVNRNSSTDNSTEKELIKFFKAQKKAGKKIVCCFGKVPVDLNVPYDGGPAHQDMADWITHTAKICGESQDIILLVKPHPHELRPEIALDLIGGFHDLIDTEIKPNVKLLGHRDINVHALAPYLDLAVLWNGSSSLELTALGIPVMMCSHFGNHDYPVDLIYPKSRKQYETYLKAGNYKTPSASLRKKAAFLISYMGTEEISILNEYALRQVTNDKVGIPRWREDKIAEFLEHGDPKMDLIAMRIVEKFEGKPPRRS